MPPVRQEGCRARDAFQHAAIAAIVARGFQPVQKHRGALQMRLDFRIVRRDGPIVRPPQGRGAAFPDLQQILKTDRVQCNIVKPINNLGLMVTQGKFGHVWAGVAVRHGSCLTHA